MEVREVGEPLGCAAFATKALGAGRVICDESPVVFFPSLLSRELLHSQWCWNCGRILLTANGDLRRIWTRVEGAMPVEDFEAVEHALNLESTTRRQWGEEDVVSVASFLTSSSSLQTITFCDPKCAKEGMESRGIGYLTGHACANATAGDDDAITSAFDWRQPSHADIAEGDITPWRKSVRLDDVVLRGPLQALWHLSSTYNERIMLVVMLLCRLLHQYQTAGSVHRGTFDEVVDAFCCSYADGAQQMLSSEKRALMRFTHRLINCWLGDVAPSAHGDVRVSLQSILKVLWLFDANVHTFIVVSPLYETMGHWRGTAELAVQLQSLGAEGQTTGTTPLTPASCLKQQRIRAFELEAQNLGPQDSDFVLPSHAAGRPRLEMKYAASDNVLVVSRGYAALRRYFATADPEGHHAIGVALYNVATKFNHSCTPNVRFLPTSSGVRAHVVTLASVAEGEQLLTSYVDLEAMSDDAARREFLRTSYGFDCQCSRCCA